jgi:predicted N-formylglutamate amidohydrolase
MVPTFAANSTNVPSYPILLTAEHASMRIPPEIEWPEEDKWLLGTHWSYDLGSEEITRELLSELSTF